MDPSDKMKPIDISNTADEHDHQYAVSTGYRVPRAMDLLNGGKGKINVDTLKQFLADNNNRDKAALGDTGFSISKSWGDRRYSGCGSLRPGEPDVLVHLRLAGWRR